MRWENTAAQRESGDRLLSAEMLDAVFRAWCEANSTMRGSSIELAVSRIRALEALWSAWKSVRASNCGYHRSMPEAVKAMDRADKAVVKTSDSRITELELPSESDH